MWFALNNAVSFLNGIAWMLVPGGPGGLSEAHPGDDWQNPDTLGVVPAFVELVHAVVRHYLDVLEEKLLQVSESAA